MISIKPNGEDYDICSWKKVVGFWNHKSHAVTMFEGKDDHVVVGWVADPNDIPKRVYRGEIKCWRMAVKK